MYSIIMYIVIMWWRPPIMWTL